MKKLIRLILNTGEWFVNYIDLVLYIVLLKAKTANYNWRRNLEVNHSRDKNMKCLYASPVGKEGKQNLAKIIHRFGCHDFDYLIFVYDGTKFNEDIFSSCVFVYEPGLKWFYAKKYLTPDRCQKYDYIFFWDDDIDVIDFSYEKFINIMKTNYLEIAQPASTRDSTYVHPINIQNMKYPIGRYTDFIDIMVPVYTKNAWQRYWGMIECSYNHWGWGYGRIAKSFCYFTNMGIIDCEMIAHCRPVQGGIKNSVACKDMKKFMEQNRQYKQSKFIVYGKLK